MSTGHSNTNSFVRRAGLMATSAMAISILCPSIALAQSSDDEAASQAPATTGLRVIVVTARNTQENIQDVPLAITAFDTEALARKSIEDLGDVARFTAGLAFEDLTGGFGIAVIRGQAQVRTAALEQPVATFLNGVYLPRSYMVNLGTSNLERIEVVKGPQSARYGRNAFAGAINYITPSADLNELRVNGEGTYGNHGRKDAGVAVSVPIIQDLLAFRGSYNHTESGGTWKNIHPNANFGINPGTNGNVGGWNNETYSANLLFTPSDSFRIEATYSGFEVDEEAAATNWLNSNDNVGNCGTFMPADRLLRGQTMPTFEEGFRLFCGDFGVAADTVNQDPRAYGRQSRSDILSVKAELDISEALSASYLYGHAEGRSRSVFTTEADQVNCGGIFNANGAVNFIGSVCNFQGQPNGNVNYDSHELRLRYDNGGPFVAAFGGYLSDGFDRVISTSINIAPLGTDPAFNDGVNTVFFDNIIFGDVSNTSRVRSVFGEVQFTLPNGSTRISAEARYTSEKIRTVNLQVPVGTALSDLSDTYNFITPRFTIEHDLSDDALLYATVARGAKAGGFNSSAIKPENLIFDPEFNWTYELGAKTTFWDGRAIVNVAAYYTDWTDMQINAADPDGGDFSASLTRNLGSAKVYGFELESSFLITDNITIDATASWNSSTFKEGTIDQQYAAFRDNYSPSCDNITCASNGDISGNDLPRSPDIQASIGAEYRGEYSSSGDEFFIRSDVSYQDGFFADTVNASSAPSRVLVNGRMGIDFNEFSVALWVRNMFDKKYVSSSLQIIQSGGANLLGTFYGQRRTLGVTASFDF